MGRGLSDLQKTILRLGLEAYEADEKGERAAPRGCVYYEEVLLEHWRLPEPRSLQEVKVHSADVATARRDWARNRRGTLYRKWHDYTEATPLEKVPTGDLYSPRAALTRAVRRLEERGLARGHQKDWQYRRRGWLILTPAGIEEARRIKEKESQSPGSGREHRKPDLSGTAVMEGSG
jgi:hypothetical protein